MLSQGSGMERECSVLLSLLKYSPLLSNVSKIEDSEKIWGKIGDWSPSGPSIPQAQHGTLGQHSAESQGRT